MPVGGQGKPARLCHVTLGDLSQCLVFLPVKQKGRRTSINTFEALFPLTAEDKGNQSEGQVAKGWYPQV